MLNAIAILLHFDKRLVVQQKNRHAIVKKTLIGYAYRFMLYTQF